MSRLGFKMTLFSQKLWPRWRGIAYLARASEFCIAFMTSGLLSLVLRNKIPPVKGTTALVFAFFSYIGVALAHFLLFLDWKSALKRSSYAIFIHYVASGIFSVIWHLSPWHPLAGYPGPIMCRVTDLTLAYIVCTGKRHEIVNDYHRRYGKFVRTGPNTLSINSNAAVSQIYATAACFNKSDAYTLPEVHGRGFFFILDREEHNVRRNMWAPAFSRVALDSYMTSLKRRTLQLCSCIEERSDPITGVDLTECFQHWAYDIMGDITFGGANKLELMAEGDPEKLVECGQSATMTLEVLGEVPWLFDILWNFPVVRDLRKLHQHAAKFAYTRSLNTSGSHDICGHLLGEHDDHHSSLEYDDLVLDTFFAGQAGSDTTASVMTFIFVFLIGHPLVWDRLKEELIDAFPEGGDTIFDSNALAKLPYLHACIEESLRLGTPFPGLRRVVPPGGSIIDRHFVPARTVVGVPGHAQQIDEENFFPDPLVFRPERWLNELGEDAICRRSGLLSFSFGPFGCLGKQLAYQEIRAAIACLVLTFPTLKFSTGFDVETFHRGVLNRKSTIFRHPLCVIATPS
ncbi:cytochrome P450 [Mycena sp. CBHHK59/15]|nr:cytochrome P450 [Mycena sp. CBHHK59/15]